MGHFGLSGNEGGGRMREIKFRAWDKEKKYFYYFSLNTMYPQVHQEEMLGKEAK